MNTSQACSDFMRSLLRNRAEFERDYAKFISKMEKTLGQVIRHEKSSKGRKAKGRTKPSRKAGHSIGGERE